MKHFVHFWGALTSEEGSKERAQKVLRAIAQHHRRAKTILELGCGIGMVIKYFPKSYALYGLDIEKAYIAACKKNVPRGSYVVSSMHDFHIEQSFDVIFSIFDSINFLPGFKEWRQTFSRVHDHLHDKGVFIFDMYTPKVLKDFKNNGLSINKESIGYTLSKPVIAGNTLTWDYLVLEQVKKDMYKEHAYQWTEHIYAVERVSKELRKQFTILSKEYSDKRRRVLFICRKK